MKHLLANVLRNLAHLLDPQPPLEYDWPCHVYTPTGTNTGHVTVTYHETTG